MSVETRYCAVSWDALTERLSATDSASNERIILDALEAGEVWIRQLHVEGPIDYWLTNWRGMEEISDWLHQSESAWGAVTRNYVTALQALGVVLVDQKSAPLSDLAAASEDSEWLLAVMRPSTVASLKRRLEDIDFPTLEHELSALMEEQPQDFLDGVRDFSEIAKAASRLLSAAEAHGGALLIGAS